ncbi:ATP-binding protein, partial [Klebsiella pneumoniae]
MKDTSLTPKIDYSHVLTELSVNRQDPCEIIRELISNSYDAGASKIYIYPLEEFSGFIFIDNGHGLSTSPTNKGISHYQAFFSIGKTTKTKGDSIGYK